MSLVRPFRARLFHHEPGADLSAFTAPPYDVVTPERRAELLAAEPHNVVALELPDGPLDPTLPGNRYETGRILWHAWYEQGVLVDDDSPAIYVVEQSWEHEGRHIRRRGFVAAVRLHPFSDGVILPHERTLPKALSDRLNLIRSTAANLSQVFGLFSDPAGETDGVFNTHIAMEPMFTAADAEGVTSKVWAIREQSTIDAVAEIIGERPIFIADGHHRYTTALAYRDERHARNAALGVNDPDPAYDYVMMTLVNMDDPELVVLPTHRLARAGGPFDPTDFWAAMGKLFDLEELPGGAPTAVGDTDRTTFLVRTANGDTRIATLRDEIDPAALITADHSDDWKRLDVTVLQELVLKPLFGIDPDQPATLERLGFVKDAHEALQVEHADAAFVLASTRMDQLRAVALAGDTMPQKSTYFYPKLLSGLLFRPLA